MKGRPCSVVTLPIYSFQSNPELLVSAQQVRTYKKFYFSTGKETIQNNKDKVSNNKQMMNKDLLGSKWCVSSINVPLE